MKKQKIIILGVSGFLGKNIALKLSKNKKYQLFGTFFKKKIKINNIKLIKADLTKEKDVKKILKNKDVVIHAAAVTSGSKEVLSNPIKFVSDNVIMNSLVCKYSVLNKVKKLLLLSCSIVYASYGTKDILVKENQLNLNNNFYNKYFGFAWIKIYLEKMAEFYSKFKITNIVVLRHSNIYGPGDKYDLFKSHVLSALIVKTLNKKNKKIEILGKGTEKRDFLYIDDFVEVIKKILNKKLKDFKIYNVGSGKGVKINKLAKVIKKISGSSKEIINNKKFQGLNTNIALNSSKIKKEIGWRQKISLNQGIEKTLDWYNKKFINKKL